MKLIWVEHAKNKELKDVVEFITYCTINRINSAGRNFQEITTGLKTNFVHCANSDPYLVSLYSNKCDQKLKW
jgi:hypothetical protein